MSRPVSIGDLISVTAGRFRGDGGEVISVSEELDRYGKGTGTVRVTFLSDERGYRRTAQPHQIVVEHECGRTS